MSCLSYSLSEERIERGWAWAAIARHGVEESGGAIHVQDMPGKGCIFTVALPGHK